MTSRNVLAFSIAVFDLQSKNDPLIQERREVTREAQKEQARERHIAGRKITVDARLIACVSDTGVARAESVEISQGILGFDHGVGHSLLLLYDAKAPYSQKSKDFNGLVHYPFNSLYKFIIN